MTEQPDIKVEDTEGVLWHIAYWSNGGEQGYIILRNRKVYDRVDRRTSAIAVVRASMAVGRVYS